MYLSSPVGFERVITTDTMIAWVSRVAIARISIGFKSGSATNFPEWCGTRLKKAVTPQKKYPRKYGNA